MKIILLILSLLAVSPVWSECGVCKLEEIDWSRFQRIKRAVSRTETREVFIQGDLVYKVWSSDYRGASRFMRAWKEGYYDDVARITAVIFDKEGRCRGYITPYGQILKGSQVKNIPMAPDRKKSWKVIDREFDFFVNKLIDRIHSHRLIFFDFTRRNVIKYGQEYALIDLESVYSVEEVRKMASRSKSCFNRTMMGFPYNYRTEVLNAL